MDAPDSALAQRIHASASDRSALLSKLHQTSFDPVALAKQKLRVKDLAHQRRELQNHVSESQEATETARRERDRQSSTLRVLGNKLRRRSADARSDADARFSETVQRGFTAEQDLKALETSQESAEKKLADLRATEEAADRLLLRLEALYRVIFTQEDKNASMLTDEMERPLRAAESAKARADRSVGVETRVLPDLRAAQTKYKSIVDSFAAQLSSAQWQADTMGGTFTTAFMDEDANMARILGVVDAADACLIRARNEQPQIAVEPMSIDREGVKPKYLFRKMMGDPQFALKMRNAVVKIMRVDKLLTKEIENAQERKEKAEREQITTTRDVSVERIKLVEAREGIIRDVERAGRQ